MHVASKIICSQSIALVTIRRGKVGLLFLASAKTLVLPHYHELQRDTPSYLHVIMYHVWLLQWYRINVLLALTAHCIAKSDLILLH